MPLDFSSLIPDKSEDAPPDLKKISKPEPLDFFSLIPEDRTTRVAKAAAKGYREGFEAVPPLIAPETRAKLDAAQRAGGAKGQVANVLSLLGKDLMAPFAVGPALFRGAQAGVSELANTFGLDRLGRELAAVPEAFIGSPGMLRTPEAPVPGARPGPRVEPGFGPAGGGGGPAPAAPSPRWGVQTPGIGFEPGMEGEVQPPAPVAPRGGAVARRGANIDAEPPPAPADLVPDTVSRGEVLPQVRLPGRGLGIEGPPTTIEGEIVPEPLAIEGQRALTGPAPAAPPPAAAQAALPAPGIGPDDVRPAPLPVQPQAPAPAQEQPQAAPDVPPGLASSNVGIGRMGPWKPLKPNHIGDMVYENPQGVRAIMDQGVPWVEATKEGPDGTRVPRNPEDRKKHFRTEDDPPFEAPKPAPKPKTEAPAQQTAEKPRSPIEMPKPEQPVATTEKPKNESGGQTPAVVEEVGEKPPAESRPESSVAGPEIVEHITGKGKTLRGVVRPDMTLQIAKQYDPYAFKVRNGVFIREKHIPSLPPLPAPAEEKKPKPAWSPVLDENGRPARNEDGNPIFEDARGVRSYTENGVRMTENVRMTPTPAGVQTSVAPPGEKGRDFEPAKPQTAQAPAAPGRPDQKPVEHPGLVITSLQTGKTTRIQPAGTVAPKPFTSEDIGTQVRPKPGSGLDVEKNAGTISHVQGTKISVNGGPHFEGSDFERVPKPAAESANAPTAEKPVQTPSEAAPIVADEKPADPLPPIPTNNPPVADAIAGSQGLGPVPVTVQPEEPEEEDETPWPPAGLTSADMGRAEDTLNASDADPDLQRQIDDIYGKLLHGWSPVDISEAPGIDFDPLEIRALAEVMRENDLLPPAKETDDGVQGALPFGDAGEGPEDVQRPDQGGEDGRTPPGNDDQGPRDAGPATRPKAKRGKRSGGGGGSSGSRGGRSRNPDRVPGPRAGPEPGTPGRPPQERGPETIQGTNFSIGPGDLAESRGRTTKARDNVAAIELAKRLTADGRVATRAEQEVLVKYVGWGGLKNAFRDSEGNFGKGMEAIGKRLEELLTPEEYATAERSTQYAHYTAEHVIRSMWDAVRGMGFDGGNVFEPGMGIGHFLGLMPPDLAEKSRYSGIEMDHLTADIGKLLYPRSGVRQADFTRMALPEKAFDLVIGNPPFSDTVISSDPKYATNRFMLHDYFFAKSLDAVRPGGLLGFVTSAGTMNKMDPKAREYLAERSEFLGGVRLPSTAFRENAGTDVTTDILFFKRRPEGKVDLAEPPDWTQTVPRDLPNAEGTQTTGNVSRYFSEHPDMVLGQEGFFDKLYKDRYAVHQTPGSDLAADLRAAVERLPKDVMEERPTPEQTAELDLEAPEKKDGSYYMKDGTLMQYRGGAGRPVQQRGKGVEGGMSQADRDRVVKLIPIRDALRDVFKADLADDEAGGAKAREALNKHYDDFVKAFGPINKAEISYKRPSTIQQENARSEAREEARFNGDRFDEGDFDPTAMLNAKASTAEIARARQAAREAKGEGFREGSFDPAEMPDVVIDRRPNIRPFMSDPESYRLRSIEDYNDQTGTAEKKAIFTENVLQREAEPEINSAHDGVLWSLNKFGRFDIDAIVEKMGKEPSDVINELGDLVYKVPGTSTWQTKDEYLSGDVVTKLEQAREAAKDDPELARNIPALEAAAPQPLPPSRVAMVLGMPWIPTEVVSDFVRDHLQLGAPRISYSQVTGTWIVNTDRMSTRGAPGYETWGTPRRNAYDLLRDALNRTPPRIFDRHDDGTTTFNAVATQAAQDKMTAISNAFFDPESRSGWAIEDTNRGNGLADIYNEKFNREVLRQFDGSYLKTPGISADWKWRPHQTRVVSRIVLQGNTYMAHAVGAGKTSAMIGAGMEMKRLGLVNKPMYVVPNHMLGQFTKEFYEQYPNARIAVADEERFHTHTRRQFVANVTQDDLDAVIITHDGFKKIPVSEEFQRDLIEEQIEMLVQAMRELDPQQDRITVGRMQKQKEKLEQRLSKASGTEKDQTLTFEQMGVDFLFVDEAHQFRKLSFATKQGQMKGITPEGSQASWDLFTKVRYLDGNRPGRSVVFASGTPVTNTMGELYSLSRFMQPEALKERGLSHFDAWAQTFGTTKTTLEETAAGTYAPVTRFGKFVNMPELYKMVGGVMDIVTPGQLEQYVTRPKLKGGARQFHMAPRTEILDQYQASLGRRMEAIKARKGPPAPGQDILLSVINDGRHAAIDPRYVADAQSDPTSKLNMMVAEVARIYHETGDVQFYDPGSGYTKPSFKGPATQMIFANLGVNSRGPMEFSGYRWIKEGLRRAGVPADQIAFIGDYKSTLMRQKLFNDMNEGKVRILVGSTQKMGTGVNAQRRLIALHNQDPLWYPADDEQRNGRILRQGNHNPEIEIHDYSTKGTYDSAMWQMMGKKAAFIEQFFRGDPTLRDMEDVGEASMYEQASAMSTTDERILTLTQMKHDLEKARRRESAFESEQWNFRNRRKEHLWSAQFYREKAENIGKDIAQRQDIKGDKFQMDVAGEKFTTRKEAAEALSAVRADRYNGMGKEGTAVIGTISGFPIRMVKGRYDSMRLMVNGGNYIELSWDNPIASAEGVMRGFEDALAQAQRNAAANREDAAKLEPYLERRFDGGDEIKRLAAEVKDLENVLAGEAKAAEARKNNPNAPPPAPADYDPDAPETTNGR